MALTIPQTQYDQYFSEKAKDIKETKLTYEQIQTRLIESEKLISQIPILQAENKNLKLELEKIKANENIKKIKP